MIFGYIDTTGPVASGWAVDVKSKNGCIIDIYIDDNLHISFLVGNELRSDVKAQFAHLTDLESDHCGFRLDLSTALSKTGSKVEFRYNKTGALMDGASSAIVCAPLPKEGVIEGVDGYKFYCGNNREVIAQLNGEIELNKSDIKMWSERYSLADAVVKSHGGKFIPFIIPEKIAIAPHLLAEDMRLSESRPAVVIRNATHRLCGVEVIYPLKDLTKWGAINSIISKSDSHLSWRAHHYIFELILTRLGAVDALPEVEWIESSYVHDLSAWDGTCSVEKEDMPSFHNSGEIALISSQASSCSTFFNPQGRVPLAIICGNSSGSILATYMRQVARVTVLMPGKSVDGNVLARYKPDIVIYYHTERNLRNAGAELFTEISAIDQHAIARAIGLGRKIDTLRQSPVRGYKISLGTNTSLDGKVGTAIAEAVYIAEASAKQIQELNECDDKLMEISGTIVNHGKDWADISRNEVNINNSGEADVLDRSPVLSDTKAH